MNEQIAQEINDEVRDRVRRIETKLSRFIAGESDRGITQVEYALDHRDEKQYTLTVHTGNITLVQAVAILVKEQVPANCEVDVFDDGRYITTLLT